MGNTATFSDNDYCFACGSRNPLGLQLVFYRDGESLCTRVTPPPHWQGFAGIVHGGLQATILDDLMSNCLLRITGVWATTAELNCRFRRPVPVGQELLFRAWVVERRGRILTLEGSCTLTSDIHKTSLCTARGRFVEVPAPDSC